MQPPLNLPPLLQLELLLLAEVVEQVFPAKLLFNQPSLPSPVAPVLQPPPLELSLPPALALPLVVVKLQLDLKLPLAQMMLKQLLLSCS